MIEISSSSSLLALAASPRAGGGIGLSVEAPKVAPLEVNVGNGTQTLAVGPPANAITPQGALTVQESEAPSAEDKNSQTNNPNQNIEEDNNAGAVKGGAENPQGLTASEQALVSKLQQTDANVRRHEQAHSAAGGAQAGAPNIQYTKGPDGKQYATSGEVSINVPTGGGDPASRIEKLRKVQQAALAPSNPSAQDLRVAASVSQAISEAQADLSQQETDTAQTEDSPLTNNDEGPVVGGEVDTDTTAARVNDVTSAQAAQAFQAAANLTGGGGAVPSRPNNQTIDVSA